MHSDANDIPPWLASLSDRTLQRLNSRLTYLLRMIDVELQKRDNEHRITNTCNSTRE
ncbi:hypothetical protein [Pseudomonas oryzihabitans]|uniref:hypothetical protein n=1 Tax=Pseudomonas oryzihabitans TaxID=47885 RepID=UPI002893E3DD|nr:hypothetical protein [Pseudomonas oryzihabitans]MDT3722878.1 hypothetical protein [Pseudomonas oryzihabitans]